MPNGAKPGERRGGRGKNTPNKVDVERAIIAERQWLDAKADGRKLAKEILEDFMMQFADLANYYRGSFLPVINRPKGPRHHNGEAQYEKYAKLAVGAAKDLAAYQSPTMRAIVVAPPPEEKSGEPVKRFTLTVFEGSRSMPASMTVPQKTKAG